MKKFLIHISIILFIINSFLSINAQDLSGSVIYKGVVNEKFVDSFLVAYQDKERPMSVKRDVIYAMKNAHPDEYVLNFRNQESYYYKLPTLEENKGLMGSRAGTSPFYVNKSSDQTIKLSNALGNIEKIPLEWKITNKTKKIGGYTCRQAKTTETIYSRQGHFIYKDLIAWFTPEIPVSFGPKNYNGLPGLILQIEDKEFTLTALKIKLNPKEDDLKIKRITEKDKVISEKESFKRIEEMMKDYNKG